MSKGEKINTKEELHTVYLSISEKNHLTYLTAWKLNQEILQDLKKITKIDNEQ